MAKDADAPSPKPARASDESWDDQPNPPVKESSGFGPAGEDPILTQAEVEAIRAQARKEILEERKKGAKAQFLTAEKARLLREEGLTTGHTAKDQMVRVTINLPEFGANILINGKPYWHGHTYTVPRHVGEELRSTMYRAELHQNQVDGKNLRQFYQNHRNTVISPIKGTVNAPAKPDGTKVSV